MRSGGIATNRRQSFERQRQMAAPLVRRHRVNFVYDHRSRGRQHAAAGLGSEKDVERLRRRHDDVGRPPNHALTFAGRSIAGAHPRPDLDVGQLQLAKVLPDAGDRRLEVPLDIVGKRLERGDIEDLGLVLEPASDHPAGRGRRLPP